MTTGRSPIDVHVGRKVRLYRTLRGMSQGDLGEALGLTLQQIQQYEHGLNRIGASRLYQLGQVLDVPVASFFEGVAEATVRPPSDPTEDRGASPELRGLAKRETLELIRAYCRIPDPTVRMGLLNLVRVLAGPSDEGGGSRSEDTDD